MQLLLSRFAVQRPPFETAQSDLLAWLAAAHAEAEATQSSLGADEQRAFGERMRKVIGRCACPPDKIARRASVVPEAADLAWADKALYDLSTHPHGQSMSARTQLFADVVDAYFRDAYRAETEAPSDLIHVTCTGYVSPSGAQRLVAERGWDTRVTHAYHMGCYAAFPALRLAAGALALPAAVGGKGRRVDIVHTELCSLHLDPSRHELEQLVVQSLFADGLIRYSVSSSERGRALRLLALDERILPGTSESMSWRPSEWGMQMTLSRDVPDQIAGSLRPFVASLYDRAGLHLGALKASVFAVHPGGPKIIDRVGEVLELDDRQLATSRDVLRDCGNMSSATLPHIWARILDDDAVAAGTLVASLAFGPGLTVCGALFQVS